MLVEKSGATAEQGEMMEKKNKELTNLRNELEALKKEMAASVGEAKSQAETTRAQLDALTIELKNEKDAKAAIQSALDERTASAKKIEADLQQQLQQNAARLDELQSSFNLFIFVSQISKLIKIDWIFRIDRQQGHRAEGVH